MSVQEGSSSAAHAGAQAQASVVTDPGALLAPPKVAGPTPWFLYFMVLLLFGLAILIVLFCIALNDPKFPHRKHRGPSLINGAQYFKPAQTGAIARPHQIPFELHRPPPLPKPSNLQRMITKEAPQIPPKSTYDDDDVVPATATLNTSNFERAANVIWALARNPLIPKQLKDVADISDITDIDLFTGDTAHQPNPLSTCLATGPG